MDEDDYRPRSPNLSGAAYDSYEEPIHPQHQQYRGSISGTPFTPITPIGPPADNYFGRQAASGNAPVWSQPNYAQYQPPQYPYQPQPFQPQNSSLPQHPSGPGALSIKTDIKPEPMDDEPQTAKRRGRGPGKKNKEVKDEDFHDDEMIPESTFSGPDIRTKFPVARIKRIMQSDEDVGKVAQVTPIVVTRALELFMIDIITKAAGEARARGSKRVLPAHLKKAVTENDQFDFLYDTVEKVADAPAPSKRSAADDDSAEEVVKKKRPGRRKKAAGDMSD